MLYDLKSACFEPNYYFPQSIEIVFHCAERDFFYYLILDDSADSTFDESNFLCNERAQFQLVTILGDG